MHFSTFSALATLSMTWACMPSGYHNSADPNFVKGVEGSDPQTVGYFTNHFALNVNHLQRSIDFYRDAFGFQRLFTWNLTQHISFTYLGHSSGGKNGSAYQSVDELIARKNNQQGYVELFSLSTPGKDIPTPYERTSLLNHIGIIVPDLKATQSRLEKMKVTIYKKIGAPMPTSGPLSSPSYLGDASHLSKAESNTFMSIMAQFNEQCIFAADPDGNLLEILPLHESDAFINEAKSATTDSC